MANIHSQKKRILRSERERLENRRYTSTIKTHFRRLEELVQAVKRGALHRNTGDRKKSRAARVRAGSSS